ncbi:MAG: class II D-tagatose-bisphosphate aldolase, non-catalytic subunit [Erysipelotrichaceae bacterium]|nr:class II D-tagatose-bisphosphate aldolase, non-catalytic subunit [Solobacterium sp.]MCI7647772.1 class II D-tagatose-bisphosphate aldolase, non-catalytic subunit [Lactobacillus johnsonii]MDY2952904.1 class II D-tagatose-bisphosphate aldolase, non-catalytic subunit [Erysipelotrichaceae bacterium]MCI6846124.1 class II D-tagatose-bisphosphate aldolase, non-catalytic subunit [Solobacterium sp.]MCI7445795.1 class II D-tagatose-bisphosphate aldolase, non-catalytic subunit [Solobacterium sp.]
MQNALTKIVTIQKSGKAVGIYSACSANSFVIEAVLKKGLEDNSCVLIESTANQCDQFGGYTGMKPIDFKNYVYEIADKLGFDKNKIFLGGDHLGPLTWTSLNEKEAMANSEVLIDAYVSAGFTKIHVDTSMKVADDDPNVRLSDETIARRGVHLVKVAENAYKKLLETNPDAVEPVYIVGSEVPIPGGSQAAVDEGVQVTKVEDFAATMNTFKDTFEKEGISDVWDRVLGIVVQPGVEEKDSGCTEYDRSKAVELAKAIRTIPDLVFEGHSTDYQTKIKLREMVEDGVAILKVGPGLTFAAREGLYALSFIEDEACKTNGKTPSNFREVLDAEMLKNDKHWKKHYHGTDAEIALKRKYSFSDRSRYYYTTDAVKAAIDTLLDNLKDGCPLNLLSQFMPIQYTKVREGVLKNDPKELVLDRIGNTIDEYLYATHQKDLF